MMLLGEEKEDELPEQYRMSCAQTMHIDLKEQELRTHAEMTGAIMTWAVNKRREKE